MSSRAPSRRRPGVRRDPEDKRERLAAAARPLFAERGFANTTTADIAAAAGVSEGLLFHHFGSKRGILGALAESFGRGAFESVFARIQAGDPILDGPFIQAPPIPDEPALEVFRDNLVVGPPEYCAERIVEEIRTLNVSHYSCFMQVGSLDGRRALTSLERFGAEVLPLVEREIGPTRAATADTAAE